MIVSPSKTPILAGKKIGVLMDDSNFSASDIFLGALKGVPGVSLFGMPSSGGSAYSGRYELHHSGIRITLARMASFRPSGLLYDGRGIDPDVVIQPTALSLVGEEDPVLDAAIEWIQKH